MSDTTTITPMSAEGIKQLRDLLMYRNDVCGPGLAYFSPERALALIAAYDSAEARAEKAEAENARLQQRVNELLSEELTDGAVRERIQLRFNMHEVLQQNEWLAARCAEHCLDRWGISYTCHVKGCAHENGVCRKPKPKDWKEAARRAVADSEVKG